MEPEGQLPPSPGGAPRDSGASSASDFRRFILLFVVYLVVGNLLLLLPAVKTWFVTPGSLPPWTSLNARWAFGADLQALGTLVYTGGANVFAGHFSPAGATEGEAPTLKAERMTALRDVRLRRLIGGASLGVVSMAGIAISIWVRVRESDPLHVEAHVRLGNIFFESGDLEGAEKEYRAAVEAGSRDGEAWYKLAQIRKLEGDAEESRELLRRGLRVVSDPTWRDWMRRAPGGPKMDPGREVPVIVVIERPKGR